MAKIDKSKLKATPEVEDFGRKYTQDGQKKIEGRLLDNYFKSVGALFEQSGLADKKNIRAIEIGCGEGHSTQRLRQLLPANVNLEASEYVDDLVPVAQKNNPEVKVIQESAYETVHKDGTFDLVFLLEVLEHLDYPDKALDELARILKPGGFLILGVPREPLWCCLNMARGKYLPHFGNTPGHFNHWSTLTLKRYIRQHFGQIVVTRTPLPWTQVLARKNP